MIRHNSNKTSASVKTLPLRLPSWLEIACLSVILILGLLMGAPVAQRPVVDDHITQSLIGVARLSDSALASQSTLP